MTKKMAIYVRVSTPDQTVLNQIIPLKKYAERMGWEYDIFEEQESTRKTRPIKNKVYQALLKGEYDGLLVFKLDRWARTLKELITDMDVLIKRKVEIISMSEGFDFSTSMGQMMLAMIGAFAQLERDQLRERVMAGLERAKSEGKQLGRPKGASDRTPRFRSANKTRVSSQRRHKRLVASKKKYDVKRKEVKAKARDQRKMEQLAELDEDIKAGRIIPEKNING